MQQRRIPSTVLLARTLSPRNFPSLVHGEKTFPRNQVLSDVWRDGHRVPCVVPRRNITSRISSLQIMSPVCSTRVFVSNTDETIDAFLTKFKETFTAEGGTNSARAFPQSLFDAISSQAKTTLRFGQLDLDRVPKDELTHREITMFAQVLAQVPIIRTIVMRQHPHLSTDRTALTFVEVMEVQLAKWTTMVPPAISRRRNRAKILMEQHATSASHRKNLGGHDGEFRESRGTKDTVRHTKADGAGKNDESEGLSQFNDGLQPTPTLKVLKLIFTVARFFPSMRTTCQSSFSKKSSLLIAFPMPASKDPPKFRTN